MVECTHTPAEFMAGVAWACDFLKRGAALNGTGAEHAWAMFRDGQPQAQLVPELLVALQARPELLSGANAILTEYLTSAGENGVGRMCVDAYASMTFEDFVRDDYPEEPSNVVPFRREACHG